MTVKSKLLGILEQQKGETLSGEKLAEELHCTRAAIWKAVKSLREEGYTIEAGQNKGYMLVKDSHRLSMEAIQPFLVSPEVYLKVYQEIDSTNRAAKEAAVTGLAGHGGCVVAGKQTAGRGRRGRSFYSPEEAGLYLSVILKPRGSLKESLLLTAEAAVAVYKAVLRTTGISLGIKWVNDLYYNEKKVCGILTEGITNFETGLVDALVIGIGINYRMPETSFPEELQEIAGTLLKEDSPSGLSPVRNKLVGSIADHLISLIDDLDSREFMKEYRQRSQVLGKDIRFVDGTQRGGRSQEGTVVDIDDNGGLVIRTRAGEQLTLNSGEITVRTI